MSDEDIVLSKKKKKMVLDDDDDADNVNVITTKTATESIARDNYDHSKANGDKGADKNKQSPKKQDAVQKKPEIKSSNKPDSPQKPKPKDSNTNAQKSGSSKPAEQKDKKEQKSEAKLNTEKRTSDSNGKQQSKPATEEKKVNNEKKSPVKQQAKPPQKKRKVESESESESSESEDEREKKKKKRSSPVKKPAKKEESRERSKGGSGEVKTVTKKKDDLVYDVLKRWWYAVPDWPPADFDYAAELTKLKLRKVDQKFWRMEPEEDKNGFKKVVEMPSFIGVYKDSKGELIDLRPKDSCPSYKNFKNKPTIELVELHAKALKGQLEELEKCENAEERLLGQLRAELKRAERTYEAHRAKAASANK